MLMRYLGGGVGHLQLNQDSTTVALVDDSGKANIHSPCYYTINWLHIELNTISEEGQDEAACDSEEEPDLPDWNDLLRGGGGEDESGDELNNSVSSASASEEEDGEELDYEWDGDELYGF